MDNEITKLNDEDLQSLYYSCDFFVRFGYTCGRAESKDLYEAENEMIKRGLPIRKCLAVFKLYMNQEHILTTSSLDTLTEVLNYDIQRATKGEIRNFTNPKKLQKNFEEVAKNHDDEYVVIIDKDNGFRITWDAVDIGIQNVETKLKGCIM